MILTLDTTDNFSIFSKTDNNTNIYIYLKVNISYIENVKTNLISI